MSKDNGSSISIGLCLGVTFGLIFDNLTLGIAIGVAIGAAGIFDSKKRKNKEGEKKWSEKD
ncbi:hypothetical protein BCR24_15815 [Enterococcus ureilyticus]|uniref:Glycine zipper-like domain-containing protein n=1 Tax=Enterococcus ureilyticus TaxID=1131292 RepID=A0A1E5HBQ9_9ENTE|nr:hypothetical protein [Enterococcus ureilyticus]MBM7690487.1 putative membrane protein [Enterococcus ureilyticus]MBO0445993.1 hypothetical protein [Enterococcus ureilyticus]OEG22368.1 hypothetical protein BCR24_15815 [Enterococcus ureilyticus]